MRSNFFKIPIARSTFPCDTNHLADSGTTNGVKTANNNGADVTIANNFQSSHQIAIHGRMQAANVKNNAIDMLATNVRHLGPTYSRTEFGKKKKIKIRKGEEDNFSVCLYFHQVKSIRELLKISRLTIYTFHSHSNIRFLSTITLKKKNETSHYGSGINVITRNNLLTS